MENLSQSCWYWPKHNSAQLRPRRSCCPCIRQKFFVCNWLPRTSWNFSWVSSHMLATSFMFWPSRNSKPKVSILPKTKDCAAETALSSEFYFESLAAPNFMTFGGGGFLCMMNIFHVLVEWRIGAKHIDIGQGKRECNWIQNTTCVMRKFGVLLFSRSIFCVGIFGFGFYFEEIHTFGSNGLLTLFVTENSHKIIRIIYNLYHCWLLFFHKGHNYYMLDQPSRFIYKQIDEV